MSRGGARGTEGRQAVFLVPHTHWDREWYEPEARFRQRLVATLDGVLRALGGDQRLRFLLDGQTILIHDYLAVRPGRAAAIRGLAAEGRLSLGPWFVLADENLSSGETLVRNLLLGRSDGGHLGCWMKVGYCPDAFGHPEALPQILRGFGIPYAVLWRGYGRTPERENDLFHWRGPDGASVLVHHLSPAGFDVGAQLPSDPDALVERWAGVRSVLEPRAAGRPLLVLNGADHHTLQHDLPALVDRLNEGDATGGVCIASLEEYFDALPTNAPMPNVRGELRESPGYAWVLYGVGSTRARLKQAVAEAERLLVRWAEPQAALAWIAGAADRRALLDAAWREHLANTFHDTFCGTTIDEVAEEAALRARRVADQARGVVVDALHDRLGQRRNVLRRDPGRTRPTLALINPSAHARGGVVEVTVTARGVPIVVGRPSDQPPTRALDVDVPTLRREDGTRVAMQLLAKYRGYQRLDASDAYPIQEEVTAWRVALWTSEVPPLGAIRLDVGSSTGRGRDDRRHPDALAGRRGAISSGWCRVSAGRAGGFDVAPRGSRRVLRSVARLSCEADDGDTYTHQPPPQARPEPIRWSPARVRWPGPLVATLEREFSSPSCRGTVHARLDAGSRLVRLVVEGQHRVPGRRLRLMVPVPRRSPRTLADMHYGPVERSAWAGAQPTFPDEQVAATALMHRYVIVPGAVTVFARGLYEYELTPDGVLAVTLLRSVAQLSRADLPARPGHAAWPAATPGAAELGVFRAELALATVAPQGGASPRQWTEVERLAEEFHQPVSGLMLPWSRALPWLVEGPALDGEGLAFQAVKPSVDGRALVLRAANVTRRTVTGKWRLPFRVAKAWRTRLDEREITELAVTGNRRAVSFVAGPREIVTIAVENAECKLQVVDD